MTHKTIGALLVMAAQAAAAQDTLPPDYSEERAVVCGDTAWRSFADGLLTRHKPQNPDEIMRVAHAYFCGKTPAQARAMRQHMPKRVSSAWVNVESDTSGMSYVAREQVEPQGGRAWDLFTSETNGNINITFTPDESCGGSILLKPYGHTWLITEVSIVCC
jgi:hypothetical protein